MEQVAEEQQLLPLLMLMVLPLLPLLAPVSMLTAA
jgi:hypothetical protein